MQFEHGDKIEAQVPDKDTALSRVVVFPLFLAGIKKT